MDNSHEDGDPSDFLASLERRHEEVLRDIDHLAERIEKTLLDYKAPNTTAMAQAIFPVDVPVA